MKKILILLGIFISSVVLWGSSAYEGADVYDSTVNITAKFLVPLQLKIIQDADFGTIIAQNYGKNNIPETITDGKISITGSGIATLKWKDNSTSGSFSSVDNEFFSIILKNGTNELNANFTIKGAENELKGDKLTLIENQAQLLNVHGKLLDVKQSTASGMYKGAIVFRVEYDDTAIKN